MTNTRRSILVTGGAGFIGSHLCDRLIQNGNDVLCVDNFFTGRKRNIEHLLGHPRFELMRHDITFPLHVEVDEIYNLASPGSPICYQRDPVQTAKTNVHGRSTYSVWRSAFGAGFFRLRRRKSTATRSCVRRPKTIGAT